MSQEAEPLDSATWTTAVAGLAAGRLGPAGPESRATRTANHRS